MNRFKIVFLAAGFNLLFEYSMRGFGGLFRRGFFLLLFLYLSYYSLVEDLIVRYRITNRQLIVVAFCFGVVPEAFLTGVIFAPPLVLGVNILQFLFINIVWWWCLQGLVTFYFATRIVQRNWNHRRLGTFGWGIRLAYLGGVALLYFITSPVLLKGPVIGYLVVFATIVLGVVYLKLHLTKPQQDMYTFQKSAILDFVSFGSVVVFLVLGTFVATTQTLVDGSLLNPLAAYLSAVWTVVVFIGVLIYYVIHKKQVTI